jgi:hypothetical protein
MFDEVFTVQYPIYFRRKKSSISLKKIFKGKIEIYLI